MGLGRLRLGWLAAVMAVALLAVGAVPAAASGVVASPKVAIIVGPAGTAVTARYRQAAEAAAKAAAKLTPNVVRVYSPDATWPAVKAAVTGASVVVYLGHGNGWPSPYANSLQPKTMDGFGLNPVAGVDDVAHQYFGESFISRLRLAPGAVVLLNHLCYASGSSEPGMADGTFADIFSRVDNYAAGFIKAGASIVVAEGHSDPASLIAAAIHGPAAMARAWTAASWGHANTTSYASVRTAGSSVSLDPDTESAGYYRSLVRAPGGTQHAPAAVSGPQEIIPNGPRSLAEAGAAFGAAQVSAAVAPGASADVTLPVTRAVNALPASMLVGIRWLPLLPSIGSTVTASDDGLMVGEASADVVETSSAVRTAGGVGLAVVAPATPGTYVVLMTLEAQDGTPYDVATQALLRPFVVVVPKPVDLQITAPASLAAAPGAPVHLGVVMTNTGTEAWGSPLYASMWSDPALDPALGRSFSEVLRLNAAWLNLDAGTATPAASYPLPRGLGAPGGSASVQLDLLAPDTPGSYELVLTLGVNGSLGVFPDQPLLVPATIGAEGPAGGASPTPSTPDGSADPGPFLGPIVTPAPIPTPPPGV